MPAGSLATASKAGAYSSRSSVLGKSAGVTAASKVESSTCSPSGPSGLILVIVLTVFFWKTTVGLRIRAVGENESAAKSVGLNVMKYKYIALLIAGCLAGIGGAYKKHGGHAAERRTI